MSIYATLWSLKFPKHGDYYYGCEWIGVTAQGVPPHIGSPTEGAGYEDGDPYAGFLPPPVEDTDDWDAKNFRAVVIVTEDTAKGTPENGQEYIDPLMTLTGAEYARLTFADLEKRICDALRGERPAVAAQLLGPEGEKRLFFDDGTSLDQ
jgi:hypothetical protein